MKIQTKEIYWLWTFDGVLNPYRIFNNMRDVEIYIEEHPIPNGIYYRILKEVATYREERNIIPKKVISLFGVFISKQLTEYKQYKDFILKEYLQDKKINNITNNNTKRNPIGSTLRHECFKRDNYKCVDCGATKDEKTLHVDHIIPVSQGCSDELINLQTLCRDCNMAKSNKCWTGGV